jgi:hypothetical protein
MLLIYFISPDLFVFYDLFEPESEEVIKFSVFLPFRILKGKTFAFFIFFIFLVT